MVMLIMINIISCSIIKKLCYCIDVKFDIHEINKMHACKQHNEMQLFSVHVLSRKVLNWFEWNLVCWHDLFIVQVRAKFFADYYSRKRTLLWWFLKKTFKNWPVFGWLRLGCVRMFTVFFQTWCDERHNWALHFDIGLNDLDPDLRSQGYEKAWTYAVIWSISGIK